MIQALFEAIRDAAPAGEWSTGVGLAREGAIAGDRADDEEIVLRVVVGSGRAYEVTLWPDDEDWNCSCGSSEDACGHVAGSIIALRRARKEGQHLPKGSVQAARLGYRLRGHKDALAITRVVVSSAGERPHPDTLSRPGRQQSGPALVTTAGDLAADVALGTWRSGVIPRDAAPAMASALAQCDDVTLDKQPITVASAPVTPHAVIRDAGPGFNVELVPAPGITAMFRNHFVVCEGVIRPVGDGDLTVHEVRELRGGKVYPPDEVPLLVTTVIPELKKRIPVHVATTRLPSGETEPPRLLLKVSDEDEQLTVLPVIVYGDPAYARIDGGKLTLFGDRVPFRDHDAERRLGQQLAKRLGIGAGRKTQRSGEEAVALAAALDGVRGATVIGDAHREYYLEAPLAGEAGFDEHGALNVRFTSGGKTADPARVLRAWGRGLSLAPLSEGGWAPLPVDWLRRYGHTITALLDAKQEDDTVPSALIGDVARLCEALDEPLPPKFDRLRALLSGVDAIPPAPLPDDLRATLRDYQHDGVRWLSFLREGGLGAMLADDMGLGKTLQALCIVRGRTLVVAPTSVLHNWRAEAERFRPSLKVAVYHGPDRALDPSADLTLTTYAILRLDIERLSKVAWEAAILDEAQTIKNPDSQVARASYRLQADFRATLTGTPVENRLDDLWSQLHFINPGLLGSRQAFKERYVDPITNGDGIAAASLRDRIRPFVLRRLKRAVEASLPPRTDIVLRCELRPEERDVYDAIRAATQREVAERLAGGGSVIAALEALLRLRQAACHRALLPGQDADGSSKVALLLERLEEAAAEGSKALVFSQWTSLLDLVEPHLDAAGLDFVRLDGSTADRQGVVDRFQSDDGPPVMLLSLKAGGTGLNLTAADHVFLLDPWWNPAVEDQAADRAHRIGQQRPVFVHRLVAEDTVEERILALQDKKRALADAAIGDASGAAGITRDDLLALLR